MKFEREGWTPLTVTVETKQEAEVLHKILALVVDETEERLGMFDLFTRLGFGLGAEGTVRAQGRITLTDKR